jgi:hypothetical protein
MFFYLFHKLINWIAPTWTESQKNCLTLLVGGTLHIFAYVTLEYYWKQTGSAYLQLLHNYYILFVLVDIFSMVALYKSYFGRIIFHELDPYENDNYDEKNHKYYQNSDTLRKPNIFYGAKPYAPMTIYKNNDLMSSSGTNLSEEINLNLDLTLPFDIFSEKDTSAELPDSLNEEQKTELNADDKCMICHIEMTKEESVTKLLCTHTYHSLCLKEWTTQSNMCPCCREVIKCQSKKTKESQ